MTSLTSLPPGYSQCPWCQYAVRPQGNICPRCALSISATPDVDAQVKGTTHCDVTADLVVGIDPGAKYLGIVARSNDGNVAWAETFHGTMNDTTDWIHACLARIEQILDAVPAIAIGVETITSPKGFQDGSRAPINPGHVARAAAVYGAVIGRWPDSIPVTPAGNGSKPADYYPSVLVGRRPKDLPGAVYPGVRTRNHEKSAYDVAGTAWQIVNQQKEGAA